MNPKRLAQNVIDANKPEDYGYIRVIEKSQIDGASLFTQTKAIMMYGDEHGIKIIEVLKHDI